jgi:hypothetical protein
MPQDLLELVCSDCTTMVSIKGVESELEVVFIDVHFLAHGSGKELAEGDIPISVNIDLFDDGI